MMKDMTQVRSLRNNNPLNIRKTKDQWKGMKSVQNDKLFCEFTDMKFGWRAAFILLCRTYYWKNQLHTLRQILSRWAPPNENNTEAYITTVSLFLDWHPDYALPNPEYDTGLWMKLAWRMACYEAGIAPTSDDARQLLHFQPLVEGWMMYESVAHKGKFC